MIRRLPAVIAAAAAALAGLALSAGPAHATPAGADYTGPVYAMAAGQCLDVAGAFGTGTSGLKLQTWACGADRFLDQVFRYDHLTGRLSYVGRNGALECVVPSGSPGYNVLQLGSCTGAPAVVLDLQAGFAQFGFATSPATVMDVKGNGTASGTPVGVFGPNGGANQRWHVIQNPDLPAD